MATVDSFFVTRTMQAVELLAFQSCTAPQVGLVHRADGTAARPHLRELIPAHATAGGKVLLAHRPRWRESVLELPLERLTERTVVDADAVRGECETTLDQGFALEDGEYRDGLQAVAAPVPDATGDVMAAIVLAGPADLNAAARVGDVTAAAAALRRKLAGTGEALAA